MSSTLGWFLNYYDKNNIIPPNFEQIRESVRKAQIFIEFLPYDQPIGNRYNYSTEVETEPDIHISAWLESGGHVGDELVIGVTIRNRGESYETFDVNSSGHSEWASLLNIDIPFFGLNPEESQDVFGG